MPDPAFVEAWAHGRRRAELENGGRVRGDDSMMDTNEATPEPPPNTQLSPYGFKLRARFELADQHAEAVLPKAFANWFRSKMRDLLERDWNYFGAVDSLVANAQIPFVVDVLRAADEAGLLTEDEKKLVPERAAVSS